MNFKIFKNSLAIARYSTQKALPLDGIRILDLTRIIAGPYASMVLSDLGAEVIKVERPLKGDESRHWGPPFLKNSSDSVYFLACNRNKKSICIDLKKGRDLILELSKKCDVVMENYLPGKLDQMGLGYEDFKAVAPQVIYCSVTGFGNRGPYRNRAGYDVIAASMGGLIHITGDKKTPSKVGVAITDICTGLYGSGAILAALLHRYKTGRGQKIDVDLFSTQISCLINVGVNYLNSKIEAERWGTEHVSIVPYAAFETKNGFLTIGAASNKQFAELCNLMDIQELLSDERFSNNAERVKNRDELTKILNNLFKKHSNDFWTEKFKTASFPYGPVNNMEGVFNDEHVKAIGIVKKLKHKDAGDVFVVGPPVVYSESENKVFSAPPTLGEHTDEILKNILNYSDDKISDLRSRKIIQ